MVVQDLSEFDVIVIQMKANEDQVQYFVFDFVKNNFKWVDIQVNVLGQFQEFCEEFFILLSVDFFVGQVEDVLENIVVVGISVWGGEEEKVGYKFFDELDDLFEVLEIFEE